jgi:hypothetical protein
MFFELLVFLNQEGKPMTDSRRDRKIDEKLFPGTQELQSDVDKMIEQGQSILYELNKLTKKLNDFSNPPAQGEEDKTRTVADEMFERIKSYQGTIIGFVTMNKALNKLSRMLFYSELQSKPIRDIIALWRIEVFSPSPNFISETAGTHDLQQFLISIGNEFGRYTPSETMQIQSIQNKC